MLQACVPSALVDCIIIILLNVSEGIRNCQVAYSSFESFSFNVRVEYAVLWPLMPLRCPISALSENRWATTDGSHCLLPRVVLRTEWHRLELRMRITSVHPLLSSPVNFNEFLSRDSYALRMRHFHQVLLFSYPWSKQFRICWRRFIWEWDLHAGGRLWGESYSS